MKKGVLLVLIIAASFIAATQGAMRPVPDKLLPDGYHFKKLSIRDRRGVPLVVGYQERLNYHDFIEFSEIPPLLKRSFLYFEDRRFYEHSGVDWLARVRALYQNIKNLRVVRGASTITEQVVRIRHPRRRSIWSRWLEGLEAGELESRFKKEEIFEFYLNQIPYAAQRRGVVQAARKYFARSLDTLNELEMVALAYLVRAPGRFAPDRNPALLEERLKERAAMMHADGVITEDEYRAILGARLDIQEKELPVEMSHFVRFVESNRSRLPVESLAAGKVLTTIDSTVQRKVHRLLEGRLREMSAQQVHNGAVLVINHKKNEVIAWVNGEAHVKTDQTSHIDGVVTPRQPGSALKPLLYAQAFERGWTPDATLVDQPLIQTVGSGMHSYRNYSGMHYGRVTVREALGNSLNIPAIHTIQFVGVEQFHSRLKRLGFESLHQPSSFYGEGLALGNGEVTLLRLVEAYATLARGGMYKPSSFILASKEPELQIFTREAAAAVSDILSDADARRLEFGSSGVFNFPWQIAIKTGTSSDFHDVWAVGYSSDYVVGIWMGNFDRKPMINVSGAGGPGLLLRSIFNELSKIKEPTILISPELRPQRSYLVARPSDEPEELNGRPTIMFPTPGLLIAMDPRVPDDFEAVRFQLRDQAPNDQVEWVLNEQVLDNSAGLWQLKRGNFNLYARILSPAGDNFATTDAVNFYVK